MDATTKEGYDTILNQKDYASVLAAAIGYRDEEDFNQPIKKAKSRRKFEKVIFSI